MKRLLSLATLLLLLASCTTEIDQQFGSRAGVPRVKTVFVASTEGTSALATKVYADENLKVLWNADDRISIFNMTTGNAEYAFTGDDGDTAGGFEEVTEAAGGADIDYVYAVYPYQAATTVSTAGVVTTVLPAEQNYKEKSFGIGANTMVAVADENFLAFKNVGGYLSFRLYGDDISVSRITIKGNNGEKIAGKAAISMPVGGTPSIVMDETATDAVSVVCNPPVKIGTSKTDYTDFWFVIPPTTFTGGFTITVTDHMGGVYEKSTTSRFTVSRNKLDWMNPIKVEPSYVGGYVDLGLPSGTMWATMNIGASTLYDDGDYFAWGETATKNSYFWGTYQYYDYDNGEITKYTGSDYSILQAADDAAQANWGGDWRMPTDEEWTELKENCTYELIRQDSKYVWKITGKNGSILFLPCGGRYFEYDILDFNSQGNGFYWSSSLVENDIHSAKVMNPTWGDLRKSDLIRYMGALVRPVLGGSGTEEPETPENPNTNNGHEYVDMGNGVMWATMNVGADSPEEYGDHFAWGEVATKDNYTWATYVHIESGQSDWKHINKYTFADGLTDGIWYDGNTFKGDNGDGVAHKYLASYDYVDDAARKKWGSTWRMPTDAEWTWLLENCDWVWTDDYNGTGVKGMVVTSKIEGYTENSFFLPAAGVGDATGLSNAGYRGDYWSSSLYEGNSVRATAVYFSSGGGYGTYYNRSFGLSVRPVFGESEPENSNTIDGHEFVDMGNGLKWATMNVGADSPEEYGDHFAWGEKTIKSNYVLSTYFDNPSGDGLTYTKYATDKKTQLDSGDDVARAKWGSTWRMPTDADWTWLKENCNWVWTDDYNGTGKAGMVVTSNVTGFENNSIFLPAAGTWAGAMLYDDGTLGTYWSSSLYENSSRYAWGVQFDSEGVYRGYDARYSGYSVRPVSD